MCEVKEEKERISKMTSMPKWIIEELKKEGLANDRIEQICQCSNIRPKISIRVNRLKIKKEELKERLERKGIEVEEGILEDFLIVRKAKNIENMDEFKEGLFTVQDEAAGLTALILNPKKGEKILDACSSPGGKTTYIAEIVENNAQIEAWDIHEHRTKLVEQTAKRLGDSIIKVKVQDATNYNENYFEKFDKILLDVPCLGLGVLKRKPDIKWQRKPEDMTEITRVQYEILKNCSNYLKRGGKIVYSTCSILKEENQNVVMKFLEENSSFELQEIVLPKKQNNYFKKFIIDKDFLQVYQNEETDGFFICKMRKKLEE